LNYLAPEIWDN
jgi:NIMA (never in mitosis gene a)-related kinase